MISIVANLCPTRGTVTLRTDGRVLDAGGTAIGTVHELPADIKAIDGKRFTAVDDRHHIASSHATSTEAAMAVHDRVRCDGPTSATRYWQAAALARCTRALHLQLERARNVGEWAAAWERLLKLDAEAARLRGDE